MGFPGAGLSQLGGLRFQKVHADGALNERGPDLVTVDVSVTDVLLCLTK
jgi:hypothetical protein